MSRPPRAVAVRLLVVSGATALITLLFLVLHALKNLQSQYDTYFGLLYLGLDVLIVISLARLWLYARPR